MGAVYRARDRKLGRDVAIKTLKDNVALDRERLERFQREARAASALNHPNIVTIHEISECEGTLYLVMELVEGRTFRELLAEGRLDPEHATALAAQVASGLAKAHDTGIVHRDLKPENLMVNDDGLVKILDFGLAKLLSPPEHADVDAPTARNLSHPGAVLGTLNYMSPEQVAGRPVDTRSDQFALGTILYEMVTGIHPFQRGVGLETVSAIVEAQPTPLEERQPELPRGICAVVERALSKDPEDRYRDLRELGTALVSDAEESAALPSFLTEVTSSKPEASPLFVGREHELDRLGRALGESGQPLFVVGEAGSGKTSLVHEFIRRAENEHQALIVALGHCDAHTGAGDPYLPFRDVLHLLCGDVEARCAAGAISRDQAKRLWELFPHTLDTLVSLGRDLVDTFVSVDMLMSLAAHLKTARHERARLERLVSQPSAPGLKPSAVLEQFTRVLLELARGRPMLVVLEDLHWADAGTVNLLLHLCRHLRGSPLAIVGSYRPALLAGGDKRHPMERAIHELRVQFGDIELVLGARGGREFIDAVVDASPNRLGAAFRDALHRQTRGHALFTVELLRELRERNIVTEDAEGRHVVSGPVDWQNLPARVEAVIAERLGRLPDRLQRLLKLASIEGEEFTAEVIARAEGTDERDVVRALSEELDKRHHLVGAVGVRRVGGQRLSLYRFRHILFQKYLYQQIDDVERSYLHEEIGTRLESLLGEDTSTAVVQLARHFDEAGLSEKAIDYLRRAGERAVRLGANDQAVEYFSRALALLDQVSDPRERDSRELELQLGLAAGLGAIRGLGSAEVERAYSRANELIVTVGATGRLFPAQWGLWGYHVLRGNFAISTPLSRQLLEAAEREADDSLMVQALHAEVTDAFARGDLGAAARANEREHALYRKESHHATTFTYGNHDPDICCLSFASMVAALMGESSRAIELSDEAIALSRAVEHALSSLQAHALRGTVCQVRGDAAATLASADATFGLELGPEGPQFWGFVHAPRGWALGCLGQHRDALDAHGQALDEYRRAGTPTWAFYALVLLVETHLAFDARDEASRVLDEATALLETLGSHFYEAELLRLKGEERLVSGKRAEAETHFRNALYTAQAQSARALELRASMSLVRAVRDDGTRETMRTAIESFPGGDDNLYLAEARTLLEGG